MPLIRDFLFNEKEDEKKFLKILYEKIAHCLVTSPFISEMSLDHKEVNYMLLWYIG